MTLRPIRPGDVIGLVAPGSPFDRERFDMACDHLVRQGYRVRIGEHAFEAKGYVAGTEAARASDLAQAVLDPEIAAVVCIRGGYGSGCLLPWMPFSRLQDQVKPLVGYSDATFLHLAFQAELGWTTFHGPNLMDVADDSGAARSLLQALEGERDFVFHFSEEQILESGVASGKVMGGNLTCLVHLMGTPYLPDFEGSILFLEDCNEQLYRLDRCINQLRLGRVFDGLAGMILGRFKDCGDESEVHSVISHHLKPFRFPVVAGLPFGHVAGNQVLPLGLRFSLNTHEYTLGALESPFSPAV